MITVAEVKTLQEWLDELVSAAPADRRSVSIAGLSDGIALDRVKCDRCDVVLNWTSAFAHLVRTEASHRLHHGPESHLHEPGDLRPLTPGEPGARPTAAWPTTECSTCHRLIVWAFTSTGKRMPVDPFPAAAGNLVLVASGDVGGSPLATVVSKVEDLAEAEGRDLYVAHFATCPRPRRRR